MALTRWVMSVLVLSTLYGCVTATPTPVPEECDMTRPLGGCSIRIEVEAGRMKVCPNKLVANAPPICMRAVLDITDSRGTYPRKIMLTPGECQPLEAGLSGAAPASCEAFAVRAQ